MNRKYVRKLCGMVLAGAMAFGLAACGNTASAETPTGDGTQTEGDAVADGSGTESGNVAADTDAQLQPLRIGIGGSDGTGIMESAVLAQKNGYFEEELAAVGFQPEYVYFSGGGPEINEALAGNQIDAAIVGDFPTVTAKSNGIDMTIVAETNQKVNYGLLTTVEGAQGIEDLKGNTVVVYNGSVIQYFWQSYLDQMGVDESEIASVNSTDATTLLNAGDAQIYPVTAYMAYYLESIGLGHVIDTADSNIWTTFVFEVKSELLSENPALGVAINKALIRAAEAAQADPQSLYDALASENISAQAWEKYYAADPTLANLSPEITDEILAYYEKENQWMLDNGVITNPVDIGSFVDASYYEKAAAELKGESR